MLLSLSYPKAVKADEVTLETSGENIQIKDGGVTRSKVASGVLTNNILRGVSPITIYNSGSEGTNYTDYDYLKNEAFVSTITTQPSITFTYGAAEANANGYIVFDFGADSMPATTIYYKIRKYANGVSNGHSYLYAYVSNDGTNWEVTNTANPFIDIGTSGESDSEGTISIKPAQAKYRYLKFAGRSAYASYNGWFKFYYLYIK